MAHQGLESSALLDQALEENYLSLDMFLMCDSLNKFKHCQCSVVIQREEEKAIISTLGKTKA